MREQLALYGIAAVFIIAACIFGATMHERLMFKALRMHVTYYILLTGAAILMAYSAGVLIFWGLKY